MYNEKPVADFTKAELNKSDRPFIKFYEQPSVKFSDYEYGLFMYEGEVYLKVDNIYYDLLVYHGKMLKVINPDAKIYPLEPDYNQVVKSTLGKYAEIISAVKEVTSN